MQTNNNFSHQLLLYRYPHKLCGIICGCPRTSAPPTRSNHRGTAQLGFIRICCDVAREDLTDFFKAWGMLTAFESDVKGYYDYYPAEHFKCSQKDIDEIVRYAKKYPKPTANLQYIHEGCLEAFKHNAKIEKGSIEQTGYICSFCPAQTFQYLKTLLIW